jgi:hypothetical protein
MVAPGVGVMADGAGVGVMVAPGVDVMTDGAVGAVPESAPPQAVRRSAARPSETATRPAAPPALRDLRTWLRPSRNS